MDDTMQKKYLHNWEQQVGKHPAKIKTCLVRLLDSSVWVWFSRLLDQVDPPVLCRNSSAQLIEHFVTQIIIWISSEPRASVDFLRDVTRGEKTNVIFF